MVFGFLATLFSCGAAEKADIPTLVKNGALIIDVRTPGEFASGAILGALNIPYDEITGKIEKIEANKSRPIILYCHSGGRADVARQSLGKMGYTQVVNAGGFSKVRKLFNQ